MIVKDDLTTVFNEALASGARDGVLPVESTPVIEWMLPKQADHGDLATNVAMVLAKAAKRSPRDVATLIVDRIPADHPIVERCEVAGPGFINVWVRSQYWLSQLKRIVKQGQQFGSEPIDPTKKVMVEFVSANPTGPLHVGHGRAAAIGDTLCRLLTAAGCHVSREFYYNDAGQQISNLALSVQARCLGKGPSDPDWPADGYQGDYIIEVARAFMNKESAVADGKTVTASGDPQDLDAIRRFAVAMLRHEQDMDLAALDVKLDYYFLESSLYADGHVEKVVQTMIQNGYTYEQDNALWLRTTDFGDDKDRVMRKADGSYTYFVPDVAYHVSKWERGFTRVINEQGADHLSTCTRVRAGLQALKMGIPQGWPDYVLHQMVTIMRGGEEVKISKRAGSYVTLRELIDEVGRDACRYFFLMRSHNAQLDFDMELAKSESMDNPVYYIQYAHARIASIFRKAAEKGIAFDEKASLETLVLPEEQSLIRYLLTFPEMIAAAATDLEVHRISHYLHELARIFQGYYSMGSKDPAYRVISEDATCVKAKLYLLKSIQIVIQNGLQLMGVSAPDEMRRLDDERLS